MATYKVNVSLPEELVSEIDEVARELGISRSGFIAEASARYAAEVRDLTEEERRHTLARRGRPTWTEEDFQGLLRQLQYSGYGWLRPEGVRRKLEEMARDWQDLPPLLSTPGVP